MLLLLIEVVLFAVLSDVEGFDENASNLTTAVQQPTPNPLAMLAGQGDDISPYQDGGVLKAIKTEGIGTDMPQKGDNVYVHYVGTFLDGTQFDSSRDRGEEFSFELGKGEVIKGWDIGVATMKRGELSVLTIKPEYAYGQRQLGPIPAYSTLVFEVELFQWTVPGGQTDLLQCPPVEGGDGGFGICANICQDDSACNQGQICCPTACGGTSCVEPIQTPSTASSKFKYYGWLLMILLLIPLFGDIVNVVGYIINIQMEW